MKDIKNEPWPHWAFKTKREWKKDVRKRWTAFKKAYKDIRVGCYYYPTDFVKNISIDNADRLMKDWYRKA
jgi:hypothetical protein